MKSNEEDMPYLTPVFLLPFQASNVPLKYLRQGQLVNGIRLSREVMHANAFNSS